MLPHPRTFVSGFTSLSCLAMALALCWGPFSSDVRADQPHRPIALHPDNPHYFTWRGEPTIFNFHHCIPPDAVAMNYDLNRVIGENETGFRGRADMLYRTEAWEFLFAGGALYNNLDYSFTYKHPAGSFMEYKSPGGGSPALRRQLRVLKDFLYGLDFLHMAPDNTVIRSVTDGVNARALAGRGKAYAIYVHVPLEKKPKPQQLQRIAGKSTTAELIVDLPAGKYGFQWVDTKIGRVEAGDTFTHGGGQRRFESPPFTADVALKITADYP